MKDYKVTILRKPDERDWMRCKILALGTEGIVAMTPPTESWMKKILMAEHSPIRTLMFTIEMQVPYWLSVHFVRHKIGVEHFVKSQRNDRQDKYDRNSARQDIIVKHIMDLNAASLIQMARKRLCGKAAEETQSAMRQIVSKVIEACPEFEHVLVEECRYRNGFCPEMKSCGRASFEKAFNDVEKVVKGEDSECFVLRPNRDDAAYHALIEYANRTNDLRLALDISEWLTQIAAKREESR